MSLYTIGDTHLSLGTNKPMDVFGGRWENYVQKLSEGFAELNDDDLTVLCGDITWGMTMEEALPDFKFIDALPGRKIILKGNHDYWWTTATKARSFFAKHDINTIDVMHNSSFEYDGVSICGTRGWFFDAEEDADKKVLLREAGRLRTSIEKGISLGGEPVVFLHYPPITQDRICPEIYDVLVEYKIKRCFYGHLHGNAIRFAVQGEVDGIRYKLVSADGLRFCPYRIN